MTDCCGCDAGCTGPLCDFRVLPDLCTGCTLCLPLCAYEAIAMEGGKAVITTRCRACGACFAGCPERAISYCRHPASTFEELVVRVIPALCVGCELCVTLCPAQAIEMADGTAEITTKCTRCGTCLYNCPQRAIVLTAGTLLRG